MAKINPMTIPCTQVENVVTLISKVGDLEKAVKGNGQKGIQEVVIRLEEHFQQIDRKVSETLELVKTNDIEARASRNQIDRRVGSLEDEIGKWYAEEKVMENLEIKKERKLINLRWLIGVIIALLSIIIGLVVDLRITNEKEKTVNETNTGENIPNGNIHYWKAVR